MARAELKNNILQYERVKIEFSPVVPPLKKITDKTKVDVRYCLIAPFAFAHIYWDPKIYELAYEIEEPILNEKEMEYKEEIKSAMRDMINFYSIVGKGEESLMEYIDKRFKLLAIELGMEMSYETYSKIYYYLCRDFIGFNETDPLLRDYYIEDIECNGIDTPVYIVHRIYRNIKTNLIFTSTNQLESFVEKLAQRCGRYISYAQPILDGSLPDGSLEYNEPFIYKEEGKIKVCKIGKFVDRFYNNQVADIPIKVKNLEVPTFNHKNLKVEWKKIDYVYRHKNKEKLYKLKLEFGKDISLTGAHSLFVLTKEGIKSEKTSNLTEDSYVVVPLKIPENNVTKEFNLAKELAKCKYNRKIVIENVPLVIFEEKKEYIKEYLKKNYKRQYQAYYELKKKKILPIELWSVIPEEILRECKLKTTSSIKTHTYLKISKELMRLLGYYIAEGWTTEIKAHKRITFCLNKNERDLIEDIKECFKECFGVEIYEEPEYNNSIKLTLNSLLVWLIFEEVLRVSHYAKTKEIPEIVFNVNRELREEFLKSWHAGDFGSTASKKLAEDISYLSLLNENTVPFYNRIRTSKIDERDLTSQEYYTNFLRRNVSNFHSMIPIEMFNPLKETHMRLRNKKIARERLRKILDEKRYIKFMNLKRVSDKFLNEWKKRGFINDNGKTLTQRGEEVIKEIEFLKKLISSDLGFVKVKKIERVNSSSKYVYDVSVPGNESFVGGTGGIMCHNSRVNATYTKDITSRGPTFTLRKFTKRPWTPSQLISFRTLSPEMLAYLWILVQYKMNILITGGTGSGKTTLLNAVAFFIPPEARVVSIEDSVTGDSRIIIKEKGDVKNITIKEFVDKKIDAEVMTLDKNGKIIFTKPSDYIKHIVNKDIYEVTTSTGRKIKVTKDHSLFSLGDSGLKEVKPTELRERESFIAVPRILPIEGREIKEINLINHLNEFKDDFLCGEPLKRFFEKYKLKNLKVKKERYRWWKNNNIIKIKEFIDKNFEFSYEDLKKLKIKSKNKGSIPVIFDISKEFLEFCGLWTGDGSYDNYNKNAVIISNTDEECRNVFLNISKYLNSNYSIMNDKGVSLRIHNSVFYKFMKNVLKFDGYSNSKKIPEFIFNLSNSQIKDFIRGYFSADGTVKKNEISCASQSCSLIEDLQTMFLRFGIISRANDFNRKDKCINLSVSSSENIEKFKEIGFLQERQNKKMHLLDSKAHHTWSDVIPISVNKVNELNSLSEIKLTYPYLKGMQNIGRNYMQRIAPLGSQFNDLSHNDILWDKVKKIEKISSNEVEVFDLSIPIHEKFLCNNIFVHNTREINLPRENWLPSVVRGSTGVGEKRGIDLFTLLRSSFRQNPDYVIVGEVRGKEAFVLFQGMASGHSSISTMHGDSVDTVIKRLETPPIELSPTLLNVLDCVCIMTHAIVDKQEVRKLREIVEIINVDPDGVAITNTPFMWNASDDEFYFKRNSTIFEKISKRYGISTGELEIEFRRRINLIYQLCRRGTFKFEEFQEAVNKYYKMPLEVLKQYGVE